MRTITFLSICAIATNCVHAQLSTAPTPTWKVTLKVVDETGLPVINANAVVDYQSNDQFSGLTDTNGIFVASHKDKSYALAFDVKKDGYYSVWQRYEMGWAYQYNEAKWNPTIGIVLKRIIKPIPMYAKRIDAEPPTNGKPVGYDLMVGDWVGPYGKGVTTDILFTREYNRKSLQDYDYKLTVSFPKAGDGIQELPVPNKNMEGSALRSPHQAPTNGYQPQIVRLNVSHPGQKLIFDYDEKRAYLFRVRTAVDDSGNVVSTRYGKIYGDFMQFKYYLNPTPNDRNIEFDPKQNLMKDLKPLEGVDAP
jgi:hypothetical protein